MPAAQRNCSGASVQNFNRPAGRPCKALKVLPKPLIPVGELPIIEHIMQQFQQKLPGVSGCFRQPL